MPESTSHLGDCPFCGSAVYRDAVLIKYQADGETRLFVECYECEEPVQPE